MLYIFRRFHFFPITICPMETSNRRPIAPNGSRIRSRGLVKFLSKYKLIIGQAKKKRRAWFSVSFSLPGRIWFFISNPNFLAPIAYMQCYAPFSFQPVSFSYKFILNLTYKSLYKSLNFLISIFLFYSIFQSLESILFIWFTNFYM